MIIWSDYCWAVCLVSGDPSPWESRPSFSMCACTDLHSARMFPSPKPVAPLRSISSRKKVSSAKMGFVNTWRRYLWEWQQLVTIFNGFGWKWGHQSQSFNKKHFVEGWSLAIFSLIIHYQGCRVASPCFASHLFFSLNADSDDGSWCRSVSRRIPCCANFWGSCPASSISCCLPTCRNTTQAQPQSTTSTATWLFPFFMGFACIFRTNFIYSFYDGRRCANCSAWVVQTSV